MNSQHFQQKKGRQSMITLSIREGTVMSSCELCVVILLFGVLHHEISAKN